MEIPEQSQRAEPNDANAVIAGQIPAWMNQDYFQRNLWPKSNNSGNIIKSCDVTPATATGDNYASILYRAKLCMENGRTHSVIAKCLPANEMRQMLSEQLGTFRKEIFLYQELLPAYTRLYERLGKQESPPWAKCLFASRDGVRDIIVMEDLKPEGYVMGDRMSGLTPEQLRLALSSLGLFHALSLVFKAENSEYFYTKVKKELDIPASAFEMMKGMLAGSVSGIEKLVRDWGFDSEADKIAAMKESSIETMRELLENFDEEIAVVNHGDFWINNFLFREVPGKATKLKMLDFQIPRYSTPALDLIYLMGSSTNKEVRSKYWKKFLEEAYLSAIHDTLQKLGHGKILKDGLYSMKWLTEELEKKKVFAFYTVITTTVIVLANPEDAPDMDALKEDDLTEEKSIFAQGIKGKAYQKRFREWLEEFIEQDIL